MAKMTDAEKKAAQAAARAVGAEIKAAHDAIDRAKGPKAVAAAEKRARAAAFKLRGMRAPEIKEAARAAGLSKRETSSASAALESLKRERAARVFAQNRAAARAAETTRFLVGKASGPNPFLQQATAARAGFAPPSPVAAKPAARSPAGWFGRTLRSLKGGRLGLVLGGGFLAAGAASGAATGAEPGGGMKLLGLSGGGRSHMDNAAKAKAKAKRAKKAKAARPSPAARPASASVTYTKTDGSTVTTTKARAAAYRRRRRR